MQEAGPTGLEAGWLVDEFESSGFESNIVNDWALNQLSSDQFGWLAGAGLG